MDTARRGRLRLKGDKKPRQEGRAPQARRGVQTLDGHNTPAERPDREETPEKKTAEENKNITDKTVTTSTTTITTTDTKDTAGRTAQDTATRDQTDDPDSDDALTPAQRAHQRVLRQRVPAAP